MKKIALNLIKFYQVAISANRPHYCLYVPTCSQYGYEAIEKYGVVKGGWLTVKRFFRCHPLSKGGLDPVP
ncbi:MAG: membrane protein insertion efficiency factor YidD [Chloroflexota bacterium]|nr:membrane protein insertion efficiency factor YidD [Chloroflexota bacterium]